jgi:hypothetical protein
LQFEKTELSDLVRDKAATKHLLMPSSFQMAIMFYLIA